MRWGKFKSAQLVTRDTNSSLKGLEYEYCPCGRSSPYMFEDAIPQEWFSIPSEYDKMQSAPACVAQYQGQKGYTVTSCECDGKTYSPISGATVSPVSSRPSLFLTIGQCDPRCGIQCISIEGHSSADSGDY